MEIIGIYLSFELIYLFLEYLVPGGVEPLGNFLNQKRSQFEFELSLSSLKLSHILLEDLLYITLDILNLRFYTVLEFLRASVEFVDKLLIV